MDRGLEVADVGGIPIEPELILVASDGPDRGKVAHRLSAARYPNAIETVRALQLLAASGLWEAPRVEGVEVEPYVRPGPAPKAGPRGPRPAHRLVRDAREAEEMAAEWTRWMGWPDATVTPVGADAGIDVVGREVVAQVKFEAVKTGRPVLQALYGSAIAEGVANHVFFSSAGYTAEAVAWADRVRTALFRFSLDGGIEPINSQAHELVNAS